ncbi:bifunctional biotin--[acetyl-CoA-carboxylase] ligase/biotin operon repressor BirA [Solimonas marina]|uniref:Bifunctional ligase/repressor BirA n=1 Tax=Solimonas marina TaxID=2714601 RepID=A0A969WB10_9GAMM|nr:bifunctional biotin--[acetyl-CoA-carboxylase] ligase/biotin operon repressor BirA [Solimonas marina]NKF22713.1 bifunctional biotin--[acetyl-CoA-carboxylase] ligase/biotin operon repressor BirA [Solimonas marina]
MAAALSEAELLALVDALADGEWHSGEDLAAASGITRAALSKRVERLRDWQLDVESRQGLGYRLSAPIERLDAHVLQATTPMRLRVAAVVDSTNTQVLDADASHDPQVLLAELQTAGRGRRGRQWISPFGANLYLSIGWSWAAWPRELSALSLAVGVACVEALTELGVTGVQLKWPNDLLAGGRKLGGILIEHRGEAGGSCRVVIGIGINVQMAAQQAGGVTQPWINLGELCEIQQRPMPGRNALAAALLRQLTTRLSRYADEGFSTMAADWSRLDASRDAPVRILNGDAGFDGIGRGVDRDGALLVETAAGMQRVHAGEVSLRLA